MKDLTVGKPMRVIVGFALPLFIGNLFQLFYGLTDTRIVGSFLHDEALAAVSATTTLNDLIVGFLVGLMNGYSVITARSFGEGNMEKVRRSFGASIRLGFIVSVILTVLSLIFLDGILALLNTPQEHLQAGKEYIGIILGGMTFAMLYNAFASTLRSVGDTIAPLIFLIISAFINIGLDLLFICVCSMGVSGASLATVISQAASFIACIIYVHFRYPQLRLKPSDFIPDPALDRQLMGSGISMGLMSSLVSLGTVVLQGAINTLGTSIIVAHGAARKITNIFMLPFGIFGMTMATYSGQNYGGGKYARIRSGLKCAMLICGGWTLLVILASYTISPFLVTAITDTQNPEVIENASLYLKIDTLLYMVCAAIATFRNLLQGIGDHRTPLVSSSIELLGKVLAANILAPLLGYMGIILTEPIVWILMVIPLVFQVLRFFKSIPREEESV